jgi:hypothetical protein
MNYEVVADESEDKGEHLAGGGESLRGMSQSNLLREPLTDKRRRM